MPIFIVKKEKMKCQIWMGVVRFVDKVQIFVEFSKEPLAFLMGLMEFVFQELELKHTNFIPVGRFLSPLYL